MMQHHPLVPGRRRTAAAGRRFAARRAACAGRARAEAPSRSAGRRGRLRAAPGFRAGTPARAARPAPGSGRASLLPPIVAVSAIRVAPVPPPRSSAALRRRRRPLRQGWRRAGRWHGRHGPRIRSRPEQRRFGQPSLAGIGGRARRLVRRTTAARAGAGGLGALRLLLRRCRRAGPERQAEHQPANTAGEQQGAGERDLAPDLALRPQQRRRAGAAIQRLLDRGPFGKGTACRPAGHRVQTMRTAREQPRSAKPRPPPTCPGCHPATRAWGQAASCWRGAVTSYPTCSPR